MNYQYKEITDFRANFFCVVTNCVFLRNTILFVSLLSVCVSAVHQRTDIPFLLLKIVELALFADQ